MLGESALARAREVDATRLAGGELRALEGLPILVKVGRPLSLNDLGCPASKSVNSDVCPRPTAGQHRPRGHALHRLDARARLAVGESATKAPLSIFSMENHE